MIASPPHTADFEVTGSVSSNPNDKVIHKKDELCSARESPCICVYAALEGAHDSLVSVSDRCSSRPLPFKQMDGVS